MNKLKKSIVFVARIMLGTVGLLKAGIAGVKPLLSGIARSLNKRLRFSLTLKTNTLYTWIAFNLLILLSLLLVSGFAAFLWYQSRLSLERSGEYLLTEFADSGSLPGDKVKRYAVSQGLVVTLFDEQGKLTYTTADGSSHPRYRYRLERTIPLSIDSAGYMHSAFVKNAAGPESYIQLSRPIVAEGIYVLLLVTALLLYIMVAIAITIAKGAKGMKKMLLPIYTMTNTAKTISAGALQTRLAAGSSYDELKDMAETFNEMLDRLEAAYNQQQQFVSDASHELRTPIAVIQGYANLLQRWGKTEQAVLEESLTAIQHEAEHMKNLVNQLLFMARADKNTQQINKNLFRVDELIFEVIREFQLIDKSHHINSAINANMSLMADRTLIKQAIRICVDNSVKFTPDSGNITINSIWQDGQAFISITDTGMGISADDLPYIFNRFYKADKSRTRESSGTGLGLSIAKWIVEKHDGSIKAESQPGIGTRMEISLPGAAVIE